MAKSTWWDRFLAVNFQYETEHMRIVKRRTEKQRAIEKVNKKASAVKKFPSQGIFEEFVEPGKYRIVADVPQTVFSMKNLEVFSFGYAHNCLWWDSLKQVTYPLKARLGFLDGKFMVEHQDELPKLECEYILLPGTIFRDSDDCQYRDHLHMMTLYNYRTFWGLMLLNCGYSFHYNQHYLAHLKQKH